ncbi:MAG: hypothetical protein ACM3SU_13150 [Acidobacteriota bacterium]
MAGTEPSVHGVAAEPDRIATRLVVRFLVALVVLSLALMLLVGVLFKRFDQGATQRDAQTADAAGLERLEKRLPPLPRLQVHATRHLREFRSAEEERLSTYGWMDRATGTVHIPIERAMDLVAKRGVAPLPAPGGTSPAPAATPVAGKRP